MLSGSYQFLVQNRVLRPLFLNFPDLGSRAMSLFGGTAMERQLPESAMTPRSISWRFSMVTRRKLLHQIRGLDPN